MSSSALSAISTGVTGAPVAAPEPPKPENAAEAARQFEALLLTQLLKESRPQGEEEDSTMETMWDMAAQQFAQVLSESGGLGLARMIEQSLPAESITESGVSSGMSQSS